MHEYSIVAALVDQVVASLPPALGRPGNGSSKSRPRVQRVQVAIGELSGVDPELLLLAYQTFREGTPCEAADLDIRRVPARWRCPGCGAAIAAGQVLRCPECSRPAQLVEGDEIVLMRIEMEVPDV